MSFNLDNKNTILEIANLGFLVLVGCFLLYRAIFCFSPDWDFLAYHLPGALKHYGLSSFVPNDKIQAVLAGFPLLPHHIQGLSIWLSGRIESAQMLSFFALFLFVIAQRIILPAFSLKTFLTGLCAIPLVVIHSTTGYVDLWSNLMLCIAFMVLVADEPERRSRALLIVLLLSSSAAVLSKYQTWPIALLFVIAAAVRFRFLTGGRFLLWGLFLAIGLSSWAVRNIVYFGNPTYPVIPPFVSELLQIEFEGERSLTAESGHSRNMPKQFRDSSQNWRFFVSMFEINRLATDERDSFRWTVDQASPIGSESPHHRMGGFFWATMLFFSLTTVYLFQQESRARFPIVVFLASILLVAFLPQAHELRYYLFIPLVACLIMAHFEKSFSRVHQLFNRGILLALAFWVVSVTAPRKACEGYRHYIPLDARAYWESEDKSQGCVSASYDRAIFFAGPNFNEFAVKHCR